MANVNKVILIGNVGRDPELRTLNNNVQKVNFVIATHEYFKDSTGNKVEQTEWHNIVMWRGLAEIANKVVKKGMKIYIEGRLQTRHWTDKAGNKRHITEIIAENFIIIKRTVNNQEEQRFDSIEKEIINDSSEPLDNGHSNDI